MTVGADAEVARRAIALVDLTDLGADTTADAAATLCDRAAAAEVAAVCVWPQFVDQCAQRLAGTGVKVATVVNFPAGTDPSDAAAAVTATIFVRRPCRSVTGARAAAIASPSSPK